MNAGAMGGSTFDVVVSVRVMDFNGRVQDCAPSAMAVAYRNCSTLKTQIALEALLRGKKESREVIERRMNEFSRKRWESQPPSQTHFGTCTNARSSTEMSSQQTSMSQPFKLALFPPRSNSAISASLSGAISLPRSAPER